jgi:sortase (surface protein transpeptidase)
VIAGHIDSRSGPAVFFHLSRLKPGEDVYVRRSDGTLAVYGPTPDAELRLITCGGTFDPALGSYLSNTVVYAAQVGRGLG